MDNDAVMQALDRLKDWAMDKMLESGEAPEGETGEKPPPAETSADEDAEMSMHGDDGAELEIEIDSAPKKPTVLDRFDFGSRRSEASPPMPPPKKRGRPPRRY